MSKDQIEKIKEELQDIKGNHLMSIKLALAKVKTDIKWIMKIQWAVVSASIGAVVVGLINLL